MNRREAQRISRRLVDPSRLERVFLYWDLLGRGLEAWQRKQGTGRKR